MRNARTPHQAAKRARPEAAGVQTGGAQRYCGRPDKGRTKPDGRSGCTRASAGWIVYQGRGVDVGLGSVLSPPKLGLHKSRFSRFGPSLFLAAATSNSNSPKRPAFFNLNQEQLLLLSPRGRSVPEPERNGWSEAHCPLRREQGVRRSAVCRRGDGTAIGSGPRTRPGAALPRSRSRGVRSRLPPLARTATGRFLGWLCPPL